MRIARIAAVLFFTAAALPVFAAAPDKDDEIVVTGQKDIEQQIESFVSALTPGSPRSQISRYERALCPRALGFTDAQRATVEARMRMVAEGIGLEVAPADCGPNLLIIVTPDKAGFLAGLRRDHGFMFGDRSPGEMRKIFAQRGAATAWQVEGKLNADGKPVMFEQGIPVNRTTNSPSRITAAARPYISGAVVVIDSRALEGFTTTQIADYAMMRGLARIDPEKLGTTAAPTILRALDAPGDAEVPLTLTQWDFAFLKGLYSGADNLYAPSQRAEIRRAMEGDVGGKQDSGDKSPDKSRS